MSEREKKEPAPTTIRFRIAERRFIQADSVSAINFTSTTSPEASCTGRATAGRPAQSGDTGLRSWAAPLAPAAALLAEAAVAAGDYSARSPAAPPEAVSGSLPAAEEAAAEALPEAEPLREAGGPAGPQRSWTSEPRRAASGIGIPGRSC